jgi:hypothetical protein
LEKKMTISEKMIAIMVGRGLSTRQAKDVLEKYTMSPEAESMKDRMEEDVTSYSDAVLASVWLGVRENVIVWMDEKCPAHWARPMFVQE